MTTEPLAPLLTCLVIDESTSMQRLTDATINGINELLDATQPGDLTSAFTFATWPNVPAFVACERDQLPRCGTDDFLYIPYGSTALYDAVGDAIEGTQLWIDRHPDTPVRPLICVWTDGEENTSRRHTLAGLNEMIAAKKQAGWEFLFVGTGGDGWLSATAFHGSVGAAMTMRTTADNAGVTQGFRSVASYAVAYSAGVADVTLADFAAAKPAVASPQFTAAAVGHPDVRVGLAQAAAGQVVTRPRPETTPRADVVSNALGG